MPGTLSVTRGGFSDWPGTVLAHRDRDLRSPSRSRKLFARSVWGRFGIDLEFRIDLGRVSGRFGRNVLEMFWRGFGGDLGSPGPKNWNKKSL